MISKIKFKDLPKDVKKAIANAQQTKAIKFYPLFLLYAITTIGLLKLGQIILL